MQMETKIHWLSYLLCQSRDKLLHSLLFLKHQELDVPWVRLCLLASSVRVKLNLNQFKLCQPRDLAPFALITLHSLNRHVAQSAFDTWPKRLASVHPILTVVTWLTQLTGKPKSCTLSIKEHKTFQAELLAKCPDPLYPDTCCKISSF